jgi:hypothetical protein
MSNAARRVLELFLRPPKQGVAGVTHVSGHSVTPKNIKQLQWLRRLRIEDSISRLKA